MSAVAHDLGVACAAHRLIGCVGVVHDLVLEFWVEFFKHLTGEEEIEACFFLQLFICFCHTVSCLLHALTSSHVCGFVPLETVPCKRLMCMLHARATHDI